jgi:four helix bundle protein
MIYDLEERTAKFALDTIKLLKTINKDCINRRMIDQLIGSAGSIGANYCEANESESKKDFIHKMCIAKKEIKETKHWIRLLSCANPDSKEEFGILWKEADELLMIFAKIIFTSRLNIRMKL